MDTLSEIILRKIREIRESLEREVIVISDDENAVIVISDDEDEVIASEILEKKTNKMHKQTNDQTNKCIQINTYKQTNNS